MRCVAELGRSLGLRVVAEGVETEAAREAIEALGCEVAQGHLWSEPLSRDAFTAYAADRLASLREAA